MPDDHGFNALAERQRGVFARRQLRALGFDRDRVRHRILSSRWQAWGSRVVVTHTGLLSREQRWWAAILHSGPGAALAGLTACEAAGLNGWESEAVHVVVVKGSRVPPATGCVVHESRRFDRSLDVHPTRLPAQTRLPRSAVDAAAWQRSSRTACAILAAAVQQRLAPPGALIEQLLASGAVAHRRVMAAALQDIAGGAQSLAEIDIAGICRRAGLEPPVRQHIRLDADGNRRYLDCEWRRRDGRVVVLEIDGGLHLAVGSWWRDLARERAVVVTGRTVLRCASVEIRLDPLAIARDLRLAGVPTRRRSVA